MPRILKPSLSNGAAPTDALQPASGRALSKLAPRLLEREGLPRMLEPPARRAPLLDLQRVGEKLHAQGKRSHQYEVQKTPQHTALKVADLLGDPLPGLPDLFCKSWHGAHVSKPVSRRDVK